MPPDCCFFFSSRRRHTRFDCDWSSDVCSSDLRSRSRVQHFPHLSRQRLRHEGLLQECRSEEHTSELQSQSNLVCRLLLEKKKKNETRVIPDSQYTSLTHYLNLMYTCSSYLAPI